MSAGGKKWDWLRYQPIISPKYREAGRELSRDSLLRVDLAMAELLNGAKSGLPVGQNIFEFALESGERIYYEVQGVNLCFHTVKPAPQK